MGEPRQSGERKATSAPHPGKRDLGPTLLKNSEPVPGPILDRPGIRTITSKPSLPFPVTLACPQTGEIPSKLTGRAGSSEIVLWWNRIEC